MPALRTKKDTQPFVVRSSPIQGLGAFATRRIAKGARIIEYVGERISNEEASARYDDESMERHHTFLFALDGNITLDAGRKGNDARYINHSCDPNCESIDEEGRIFVEAIKDIPIGTELTYDYRYTLDDADWDDEELRQRYVCRCGAKKCRGTILLPPAKKPVAKKAAKRPATKRRTQKGRGRAA